MIQQAIRLVTEGQDMPYEVAKATMNAMMSGEVQEVPMAAFLGGLQAKGPSVTEITAFAEVMREKAGGDGSSTFNISTTSAILLAAAGIPIAKHGNRSVSSKCGAADVLEALGVKLELNGEQNRKVLEEANICFMFAPVYHEAMKYAGPVRKAMGVRTVFNILGPLANPAGATVELMGVYDRSLVEPLAQVLSNLGVHRGAVVYGSDGLDDITATGTTTVCEIDHGTFKTYELDPKDYGFSYATEDELVGGDAQVNAEITRTLLEGKDRSGRATAVILNAGMAYYLTKDGEVTLEDAFKMVEKLLYSGAGAEALARFVKVSQNV